MSEQRITEWMEGADWDLFERQYKEPYRINLAFFDWLNEKGFLAANKQERILYVGAGMGANLFHVRNHSPGNTYDGIDLNPECVAKGNARLRSLGADECHLEVADLYRLPPGYRGSYKGVFSLATLSWLPDFESAAGRLMDLDAEWIAATSLFYDGPIEATINTKDFSKSSGDLDSITKFYNIYSLPKVERFLESGGYAEFHSKRFEIDIDLPKPAHAGMGTYTEKLENGSRLQISGPVLMNWHFILACKPRR